MNTGFIDLDKLVQLEKAKLIILASRPAMGKSTLALNILEHIVTKENLPILYYNLESSKEKLMNQLQERKSVFSKGKINIDDTPNKSIYEICAEARKYKMEQDIQFLVIDYLQLIGYEKKECLSRDLEIKEIIKKLKSLSKELNIPILVLSQLSRELEKRENHRPVLTDFSNSQLEICTYADIVLFLYRDDYYNKHSGEKNVAEIIIAKNEVGNCGTVKLAFLPTYYKFVNLEK